MQQVAENTYALGTRGHNFYLLVDGRDATLIDTGCSKEWNKLAGGLESLGMSLASVRGIVATHSHSDHFGMAKRAQSEGVPVAVHEDEETRALGTYRGRYAVSPGELPKLNPWMLWHFFPVFRAGVMSLDHVDSVLTFSDGDRLDLPARPVAVHTPGHTEGHTMYHVPERGLLFSGDGLVTMDMLGPGKGPQLLERRFNKDHSAATASLDRIKDLDARLILPGHGSPWPGTPANAVELARG
jgi:glyoxylase-like metal-dependent hydrolase (beta-lactamase superfamily II)